MGNPIGGGEGYSDIVTGGDFTARTYNELTAALAQAPPGQIIFIPADAAIDFAGRPCLTIPGGVTLAGDRGYKNSPGGLLYSDKLQTYGMLQTGGDYARITGLRIRGPYDRRDRTPYRSYGLVFNHFAGELDNCELYSFAYAASLVMPGATRTWFHHNYIHHNQRNGLGYGTQVLSGQAIFEANIYDACRHHVASDGQPGSSYEARFNMVGPIANNHLFDMHGGRDRGDMTTIAGDFVWIHHNTTESDHSDVVVRGVPNQGAWVHHNWFAADKNRYIVGDGNMEAWDNLAGPDKKPLNWEGPSDNAH
jgi:hypothetical protein